MIGEFPVNTLKQSISLFGNAISQAVLLSKEKRIPFTTGCRPCFM